MKNPVKEKGDSKAFFVFTVINGVLNTMWLTVYLVCLALRAQAFNTAQANMMLTGQSSYTVEVTSPFFTVLRIFAYLLPVIITVWTVLMLVNDRKNKKLCDKWLIGTVFGMELVSALLIAADITMLHMVF